MKRAPQAELLRELPAIGQLVQLSALANLPPSVRQEAAHQAVAEVRAAVLAGSLVKLPTEAQWLARIRARAEILMGGALRRVLNATGVVLHTNLGRAPLATAAVRATASRAVGYSNLELDLEEGVRGSRHAHVSAQLRHLTGAEAALVVNNNAAAVLLAAAALAPGGQIVVSRGELVEIGGSFRVPEVIVQSGAQLREVGTTNKTHAADYEAAIGEQTAMLLKVHQSNFRQLGFTASVEVEELAELAHRHDLPLMVDLGSGVLVDLAARQIAQEPTVTSCLRQGADLCTFSGDKLLGGPQAGIIVGRAQYLERLRRHPLMRALRPDKLCLAALSATLALYARPEQAWAEIPVLEMLGRAPELLARQARLMARALRPLLPGLPVAVEADRSEAGGGSLPGALLPTSVVALGPHPRLEALAAALRRGEPAVLARISGQRLRLDPRTLSDEERRQLPKLVQAAWQAIQMPTP